MNEASADPRPTAEPNRPIALVADDAPGVRLNLSVALKTVDPSIRILEAETGRKAIEILATHKPGLAFLSVQLPEVNGAEVLAYTRAQGTKPFSILMSSLVMPRWVELSNELEAYEFLKKPFDPEHVVSLLKAHKRMQRPARTLLVDDSATARQLVRRMMTQSRFQLEIDETDTGQHALKLLKLTHYDLAVIDVGLVGIDGLETACQARDIAPDTKIILMSGTRSAAMAQAARHFGIVAFLKKPFYARDVDLALHTAFGLRRPYLLNALRKAEAEAAKVAAAR